MSVSSNVTKRHQIKKDEDKVCITFNDTSARLAILCQKKDEEICACDQTHTSRQ